MYLIFQKVKIDAHKKFSILWHLLRDRQPNVTPGPLRTFDRYSSNYLNICFRKQQYSDGVGFWTPFSAFWVSTFDEVKFPRMTSYFVSSIGCKVALNFELMENQKLKLRAVFR